MLYFTNLPITGKEGSTLEYLSLDQNSSKSEEVDRSRAMQNDFFPSLNGAYKEISALGVYQIIAKLGMLKEKTG